MIKDVRMHAGIESEKRSVYDNEDKSEFFLRSVNLKIYRGERVMVYGESSSGKSSLLYSILGEMSKESETTRVLKKGKVAFMKQSPWIFAGSIKENIILGEEYNEILMEQCLRTCQIWHDLELQSFDDGLETILGDTSDNISGGQKARIALARCFYQK